jgi:hypothetical protein
MEGRDEKESGGMGIKKKKRKRTKREKNNKKIGCE